MLVLTIGICPRIRRGRLDQVQPLELCHDLFLCQHVLLIALSIGLRLVLRRMVVIGQVDSVQLWS